MKYFILKQDKEYKNAPKFINWFQNYDMQSYEAGNYQKLPERKVIEIEANTNTTFLDVLTNPFFLVTKEVKKVLNLFEPNMEFRQILCLDRKNKLGKQYFLPCIPFIACLSPDSQFNLDHSILLKTVLEEDKIPDKGIFWLAGVKSRYVVVRLDIVEAILRKEVYGIDLQEVEVIPKGGQVSCQNSHVEILK